MGQLSYPPHERTDYCPACPAGFAPRPAPCCGDGQMHVLSIFNHGKTGAKMLLLECSDCGRQLGSDQPTQEEETYQVEVPESGSIEVSGPPASSSLGSEIKSPRLYTGTTTTATVKSVPTFNEAQFSDPAPRADDPIEIVEYESWMFFETTRLVLDHWKEMPNVVIRHAVVEDAVLHARSLCEVIVSSAHKDTISLKVLFQDLKQNRERYKVLREARGQLEKEYDHQNGKSYTYRKLFNERVMHPTILRGSYGLYEEPLRRLYPKIHAVIREIATLNGYPFRLPADGSI